MDEPPAPYGDARAHKANLLPLIRAQMSTLARKHRVPGAQLAIHHDGETVDVEVGELQHGAARQVTRAAAFPVGSITKSFTATLAMVLVADGDLELDAPLGEYLSDLDELGERASLRHMLSHTSGLAAGPDSEDISSVSLARYVADHCRSHNLVQAPGTGFSYSNMAYVLVGRLIETVTGMSWREAMESILLRPLGIEAEMGGARLAAGGDSADHDVAIGNHAFQMVFAVEHQHITDVTCAHLLGRLYQAGRIGQAHWIERHDIADSFCCHLAPPL